MVERLTTDGIPVVAVPAKLSARVRLLATGHGRKTDVADAVATAIAALTAKRLRTATVDEHTATLRLLSCRDASWPSPPLGRALTGS